MTHGAAWALLLVLGGCNGGGDFFREPCHSDCEVPWAECMAYCFDGFYARDQTYIDDDDSAVVECPASPVDCDDDRDACQAHCEY